MQLVIYRDYEVERGEIITEHGVQLRVELCIEMEDVDAEELLAKGLRSWGNKRFKIIARPLSDLKISDSEPEME